MSDAADRLEQLAEYQDNLATSSPMPAIDKADAELLRNVAALVRACEDVECTATDCGICKALAKLQDKPSDGGE